MANVLIVDDEADVRLLLSILLSGAGHRVSEAVNGQAAIEQIERERPDLVLTDLMMPVMDGEALVDRLRRDPDPSMKELPIILVTATHHPLRGVDGFVRKPFKPEEVLGAIDAALRERGS